MSIDTTIVGGGMIVHDQILPSVYHLQRTGHVGAIGVVATQTKRLRDLLDPRFSEAFPGQTFHSYPALDDSDDQRHPDLWRDVVATQPPRQLAIVATPDRLHDEMIRFCLEHDQHVLCVKPLVQHYEHAQQIEQLARERGLFVGVEYHKRFDRRSLDARSLYRAGRFGEFQCGDARMVEPYYYRHSNFQNWFTTDQADAFTYVGCHYVDLVYFITGLRPTEVSVRGVKRMFPNGNTGYLWANGRVIFENGAVLSVVDGLGYPDRGAGTNDQGLCMFCEGDDCGSVIRHDDQFRGVCHSYVDDRAGAQFRYVNPDYFRLVPWLGDGLRPVGYGYDSIEASVLAAEKMGTETAALDEQAALERRRALLQAVDQRGIIATPGNSFINELVVEASRISILEDGTRVAIEYEPSPRVVP
ncbi:MAG: Gfo/Idh/MocA family protein [Pirellulales bacterium]